MNILRCKFTKEKDMIYISHLDLLRLLERCLRKAKIKFSFSQGFNPHPKIAFAQALSLGVSSLGEYVDIEMDDIIDKEDFLIRINTVLPDGIKFLKAEYIDKTVPSLMSLITHSGYIIEVKMNDNVSLDDIKSKINEFMKKDEIMDTKENKKGKISEVNIRPLIKELNILSLDNSNLLLNTVLAAGSKGTLKPNALIEKLSEISKLSINTDYIKIMRKDLYIEENENLNTPI